LTVPLAFLTVRGQGIDTLAIEAKIAAADKTFCDDSQRDAKALEALLDSSMVYISEKRHREG
jgi:hypothetical protein